MIGHRQLATGGAKDSGPTARGAVPGGIDAQGSIRLSGGNTAECHVVCGYRFRRPPASGNGCLATCPRALPLVATSPAETAAPPQAMWMLKRHSAVVRVIAAGSAAQRL